MQISLKMVLANGGSHIPTLSYFMSLLTFVLMLGLGFGDGLSPGCNIYLVVDMA